jgi:Domain of unknown function (DUF4386)
MTNRTVELPERTDVDDRDSDVRTAEDVDWSMRRAGLTAGVAILLLAALATFGTFVAVQRFITPGDASQTAEDVIGSANLFRLGIVSLLLVVALDVVVAWALYRVFTPVSRSISLLAAVFRIVYAGVFLAAISQLIDALRLLGDDAYLSVFTPAQLQAQALSAIDTYHDLWTAGLVLFGLHLLLVGYLAFRSAYVPSLLGVLLVVAGLGYVVDSLAAVLADGAWTEISSFTFVGEFLFALWLLVPGRRLAGQTLEISRRRPSRR